MNVPLEIPLPPRKHVGVYMGHALTGSGAVLYRDVERGALVGSHEEPGRASHEIREVQQFVVREFE